MPLIKKIQDDCNKDTTSYFISISLDCHAPTQPETAQPPNQTSYNEEANSATNTGQKTQVSLMIIKDVSPKKVHTECEQSTPNSTQLVDRTSKEDAGAQS